MTPERAAELVIRWVRFYTRGLPAPIAERRVDEITADLHDHIAHERAEGDRDARIAARILSRMARGIAADVSWRRRLRPLKGDLMKSYYVILAATLAVAAFGVIAIVEGEAEDAPGLVLFGTLLITAGVVFGVRTAHRSSR